MVTLATPPPLAASKRYVLAIVEVAGKPWSGSRVRNRPPSFLVIDDTRVQPTTRPLTYPNLRDNKPGQSNEDWTMTFDAP